jgi:hypothetical protein
MNNSQAFLLNQKSLRLTMYLSLAIANIIFGALYPNHIAIAGCGFAFFATLTMIQLRPESPTESPAKSTSAKKAFHFDK